ncbi:hypothetical protein [Streptomyces sp. NBC_00989]|uniref:hypothetical protein n=1 Tax=Streptomyces sp. NBC_00989 TaxID=2903705 RepID=UPI002F910711|nr:hypothetical protein OG714_54955 [Streptomyces sp. NBC_00989]
MRKKPPTVQYTLQRVPPSKTSWWVAHRHQVLPVVALVVVAIAHNADGTNPEHTQPSPPAYTTHVGNPAPVNTP